MGDAEKSTIEQSHLLFDNFIQATTCKGTFKGFQELSEILGICKIDFPNFYPKFKSKLNYWKAKALFSKLDKRGSHKDYKKNIACANTKCLVIGAGPCGLRTAIELAFLGAKAIIVEKRDTFSRNNVLHLWPYTIQDLRNLGAKKIYGKFCAGAIDHISIRQLQLVLLKIALILGIEIHLNVEFRGLLPPRGQKNPNSGWRAEINPSTSKVTQFEFDVVIGADGRRNTLEGFRRKEFRGKLAIAITANFINRHTREEAQAQEISGVAFIFNQKFFQDLREATGVDLENIVYYKDDTHYFVMTAKKQSLLDKGVIQQDFSDTERLLSRSNMNQEALLNYVKEAANFSTNHQLPRLDFAMNHYGQPDVAMFDFTCMYASENASLIREEGGKRLLVALVGDSLLEPFWPMGTGIARGFLAAFDAAWMVRSWAQGTAPLSVLAERESIYRLLPQTTPQNISKNFNLYSIDPVTRYPKVNIHVLDQNQVRHLYNTGEQKKLPGSETAAIPRSPKFKQPDSLARSNKLLAWCQKQTQGYKNVNVIDLTTSWKSGLALSAIIHHYRPDLIDFDQMNEKDVERNNQMAFDIAEREFGISPIMTGKEMAAVGEPDKLSMVMYLSQFYEMLKDTPPEEYLLGFHDKSNIVSATKSPISFLSRLGQSIARKRGPKDILGREAQSRQPLKQEERDPYQKGSVKSIANQFLAKSDSNVPGPSHGVKRQRSNMFEEEYPGQQPYSRQRDVPQLSAVPQWKQQTMKKKEFPAQFGGSDVCYFCGKRVYVMERLSAEGKFFHRGCFKCAFCGMTLRLATYAYNPENGKFYCKPHYRLGGREARKRPATPPAKAQERISPPPPPTMNPVEMTDFKVQYADEAAGTLTDAMVEPCQAKRLRGTPERIELENIRVSLEREEDLQEVPEETLAEHNLSSAFQQASQEPGSSCSSSEYEMEDEEEDEDNALTPSDLGGVPWMEAVRIHRLLKGDLEGDSEAEDENEEQSESSYEQQGEVELSPDDDEEDGAVFEDDIASDAEAENLMISYTEELEQLVREKEESCGEIGNQGEPKRHQVHSGSNVDPQPTSDSTRSPPEQEDELLFPGVPFVKPIDSEKGTVPSHEATSLLPDHSPVRSQPLSFPETPSPCSAVQSQPVVTPLAQSPSIAPPAICCQPLTCPGAASPITAQSPVKCQPVSSILTSTPIITHSEEQQEHTATGMGAEKPTRKDPADDFWLRSMELRKSLGVSPVDRTSGSETSFTLSTTGSASPQSFTPEEMFEEQRSHTESPQPPSRPPSLPGVEELVLPALTSSQSIGLDAKSSDGGHKDLTSTSGLGLNGSLSNTRTAASVSLNNSDSMLTPPSSPPPPPPAGEEPATLRRRKHQDRGKSVVDRSPTLPSNKQPVSAQQTVASQPDNVRKSLAESIDEIPFADDVEDTYDDRTPDTSVQERFYTPPSSKPKQEKPCLLKLAQSPKTAESKQRLLISPEAKEIAEERMRAREKSVKSQVLRDAMEKQLRKMKEMEMSEVSAGQSRSVLRQLSAQEDSWADTTLPLDIKLTNGHKLQQESVVDRYVTPTALQHPVCEGSGASSEDSASKNKKRTSLFSPRKSKKEKKSKSDSRQPHKVSSAADELTKPKSLWKSVFSSYRKDRKKKEERACPSTPSSSNTIDSSTRHTRNILRTAVELQLGQHLSLSEDSDLSNDDVLERSSQRSRREKPYTEEELNSKLTRRVQKAARRQAKQEELKRLHRAQIIQRQLEQVEEKQRQLEERGVAVEKALRGEADYWGESSYSEILDLHLGGMGKKDDPRLMQEWFKLVQEKNSLVRYESELMIFARELELEDRQSRLQQELRERMAVDDNLKSSDELSEEKRILNEMLEVVEQRDSLVALLEEQRLREKEEDKDLEAVMLSKSYNLNWS
ncbi:protein-methionine sulfoxide oxidase mical3a-like isoform X4 [Carcharodon carcharias]|uniref:protein-methionine sulfoxide oxidase mical3a-like isoform X4 n=1 Tax=Carcharodon carcharias TaxID=13397 RepID=UPI001B7EF75F|nr:protein-methionine sulfoxide oxidase mical3a-like isoform X4 [Carcharodon carcharias]